ncbi:hypothetical protein M2480_002613 [Parabacteroides sp. PFB2-12]|uniref:RagB/SusD family nutrient uptake outer membrane protein n=1 Tax=unclassified Parabacteroides TaxID=2649774 RepID=UPI0024732A0B|nr:MULTISPECIES: RagB/SusD family nutrient uptake outer membrane protein [unclassified Parabacteroides]MDH6341846.1 hypothetical protein [Parabacteroides sp. PM6-13]MDH6391615.1 hypothetical protein [Parabacteroides sp. PFB2-12]
MKRYILSICAGLLFLFTSCNDFLDTYPPTNIPADKAIETIKDAESAIYGIYTYYQSTSGYNHYLMIYGDIRADDIQSDNSNNGAYNYYVFNHANSPGSAMWSWPMKISRNASRIIEAIDKGKIDATAEELNHIKGQAIALRAMAHFDQVKLYAPPFAKDQGKSWGAIIIDHVLEADELPVRSTVDETFRFITSELEKAIPMMKKEKHPYNLMNAYGAKSLLARAYLYWDKNDKAYETASSLIEELKSGNAYRLFTRDEYLNAFAYNAEGTNFNPESFMECFNTPTDNPGRDGLGYMYHRNGYSAYMATRAYRDLIQSDPDDIRNGLLLLVPTSSDKIPYVNKYPGKETGEAAFDNNYPILRLSETYLIAAEAAVKGGGSKAKGLEYLNAIVKRANPAKSVSDDEYTLDRVLEERRKELFAEGHRYFDLLRNGRTVIRESNGYHYPPALQTEAPINWDFYLSIFGIPYSEFLTNPKMKELQQQNPGYKYE